MSSTSPARSDTDLGEALEKLFRRRSDDPSAVKLVRYERIVGGYSRMMVRVWMQERDAETAYILRADPPAGDAIIDTDRADEWALLCALRDHGQIPMPRALWFEPEAQELGTPVIVTEMIDGASLLGAAVAADTAAHRAMAEPLCELASTIHAFPLDALPASVERPGSWEDYIDGRIEEWIDTERALPGRDPFIRMFACWMQANKPPPVPLGLVHGDFQPGNVVVDRNGEYHMVDWELAHVGDPREDLGYLALCGITQPPPLLAEDPQSFYQRYAELMGYPEDAVDPAAIAYFTVLGTSDVFLGVLRRLATLSRGEATSALLAYMADAVAGMENVFLNATAAHARANEARR